MRGGGRNDKRNLKQLLVPAVHCQRALRVRVLVSHAGVSHTRQDILWPHPLLVNMGRERVWLHVTSFRLNGSNNIRTHMSSGG